MNNTVYSQDEYLRFVGMFVSEYAKTEFHFRRLLHFYSGLQSRVFEALIGFPRTSDAIAKLQKLAVDNLHDKTGKAALKEAFSHLTHITKLRDWVVHYGGNATDEGYLVRLKPTEISVDTGESYHLFTRVELYAALIDMQLVVNIILHRLDETLPAELRRAIAANGVRSEPWRYKPPRLKQSPR